MHDKKSKDSLYLRKSSGKNITISQLNTTKYSFLEQHSNFKCNINNKHEMTQVDMPQSINQ